MNCDSLKETDDIIVSNVHGDILITMPLEMPLEDWYAGLAMQAFISKDMEMSRSISSVVADARRYAQAMIQKRGKDDN